MSSEPLKLDANIAVGSIIRAMGEDSLDRALVRHVRVTVAYRLGEADAIASFTRKGGDRLIVPAVEIDRDDAIDALDLGLDGDEEDVALDDGDLHEFIAACLNGDRSAALALVPRLFEGANADTAERLLLYSGRRAA